MPLFDPGLQPERTELAWRRTALSVGVGSLVAVRLLPIVLGDPWWALVGVLGVVAATALWLTSRHRYRISTPRLVESDRAPMPSAIPLFAVAVGATVTALVAAVVVVAAHG